MIVAELFMESRRNSIMNAQIYSVKYILFLKGIAGISCRLEFKNNSKTYA